MSAFSQHGSETERKEAEESEDMTLDLIIVGNCSLAAFLDSRASLVWCAFPRPDSSPLFAKLINGKLGQKHGFFDIALKDFTHSTQRYLPNTAIVETTLFAGQRSAVQIIDFCPRFEAYGKLFRPQQLVRVVKPVRGQPLIRLRVRPSRNYGVDPCSIAEAGCHHLVFPSSEFTARLTTDAPISFITDERWFVCSERLSFVLGPNETLTAEPKDVARDFLSSTRAHWERWTRHLRLPFEWQQVVIRAALTLKLCCWEESGALLSALSTSIPEYSNSGRTWDYRFCWLRESHVLVQALSDVGDIETLEQFLEFIMKALAKAVSKGGDIDPLYSVDATPALRETKLAQLPGFRNMGPVRVGNDAFVQRQNDKYGSVVMALSRTFFDERLLRKGDAALFKALETLGHRAISSYDKPDSGKWEVRTKAAVHTHSAVMCWVACDRLAKIAQRLKKADRRRFWGENAARIQLYIFSNAWNAKLGSFVSDINPNCEDVDASLLLLAELGFLKASDERFRKTVEVCGRLLRRGSFIFRYVNEDDYGRPENAYIVCTFWYIKALASIGRRKEAKALFEGMLKLRNRAGILSEDVDPATGELWGNFPQSHCMGAVIDCAMHLSDSWRTHGL